MALTATGVKNAKPKDKPYKLADGKGLYLLVTPGGSKLWRFDYRFDGKRNTLSLGKWNDVELAQARERRDEARKQLAAGHSPSPDREAERAAVNLFETVARNWHASAKASWTARYAKLVLGRLEADIFPDLGRDDIDQIEPPRLLELSERSKPAARLKWPSESKITAAKSFNMASPKGSATEIPPADIRRALMKARPKQHRAAVSPSEFPNFISALRTFDGDELTKLALNFTLLTMVRTQETRFATWQEFEQLDSDEPLWRLSADRMKMSREHLVPLPRQTVNILKRLRELSPDSLYLFQADTRHGVISENTMLYAIYRIGYHSRQTTHGLRRCASTVLNETGLFEPDWVETQLAHTEQNKVRGAYNAAFI